MSKVITTFSYVMETTEHISPADLQPEECRAYYDLMRSMPDGGARVAEIGLRWGRSSSILARVGRYEGFRYTAIDPFIDPPEAKRSWIDLMDEIGIGYTLLEMTSKEAFNRRRIPLGLDCLLVDGDHSREAVVFDCTIANKVVEPGGYVVFHDYGDAPTAWRDVEQAVIDTLAPEFSLEELVGTLAIWKRMPKP